MGFSETEADLYKALLKIGEGTIAECIQLSKVKRAAAYNIMDRLVESGLVVEIQGNPKRFCPAPPRFAFEELQNRRLKELNEERKEIPQTVEELVEISEEIFKEHPIMVDDRREFMLLRGTKMMDDIMKPLAGRAKKCQRIFSRFPLAFPEDSDDLEKRARLKHVTYDHRVLFESHMIDDPKFLGLLSCDFNDEYMEFRHMESLPIKLVIFDDFAGVVTTPNNSDRDKFESVLTYNRNLIEFYITSFDSYWERAKILKAADIEERLKKR